MNGSGNKRNDQKKIVLMIECVSRDLSDPAMKRNAKESGEWSQWLSQKQSQRWNWLDVVRPLQQCIVDEDTGGKKSIHQPREKWFLIKG